MAALKAPLKIGNGAGFWGDNLDAPYLLRATAGSTCSRSNTWPS